ncbi:MAG: hypothetical protein NTU45_03770 [Planctomycetota bacterium]|jgi:hypothetical protein|nr:hypothetical protein [Planctomycetota bacterium]
MHPASAARPALALAAFLLAASAEAHAAPNDGENDPGFDGFSVTRATAVIDEQEFVVYRLFARFSQPLSCEGVSQFRIVSGNPVFFHKDHVSELELSTTAGSWNPQQMPPSSAMNDSYFALGPGVGPSQAPVLSFSRFPDASAVVAQLPLPSVEQFINWERLQGPQALPDGQGLVLLAQFVAAPGTTFRAAVTVEFREPWQLPGQFEAFGDVIFSPTEYDECPKEPGKVFSGVCGCEVPETDSDGDLQPDCVDPPLDFVPTLHWNDSSEPSFLPATLFGKLERRGDLLAVGTTKSTTIRMVEDVPQTYYSGGVLLAERTRGGWESSGFLLDPDPPTGNLARLGWSVDIGRRSDGSDIVVVGGYTFDASSNGPFANRDPWVVIWSRVGAGAPWVLESRLAPPSPPASGLPRFGSTVATTGDRIAVAEPLKSNGPGVPEGKIHLYRFVHGEWIRTAELIRPLPSPTSSAHRFDLVFDGDRLLVGDRLARPNGSTVATGLVFVYELAATNPKSGAETWELVASLADPRPTPFEGGFGASLSLDGDRLAVGADRGPNPALAPHGAVHLFRRDRSSASGWVHETMIRPIGFEPYYNFLSEARFGGHVDLKGDLLVVQAGSQSLAAKLGATVFRRTGGAEWVPVVRAGGLPSDYFSSAMLIDGALARVKPSNAGCSFCTNGRVDFAELSLRDCGGDGTDDPDTDGDGLADCLDPDANGNGRDDLEESSGDLNGDGLVGGADLTILLANWGANGLGDLDGDGTIGPKDLAALFSHWQG